MFRSSHHLDDESTDSMTSATNLDDILSLQVDFFTAGITIMTWPFSESLSSEGSGDEESLSCQTSLRNWRIGLLSGDRVGWWYFDLVIIKHRRMRIRMKWWWWRLWWWWPLWWWCWRWIQNEIQERTNLANGGVQGPVSQSGYLISLFLTYFKTLSSNLIFKLLKMKKKISLIQESWNNFERLVEAVTAVGTSC